MIWMGEPRTKLSDLALTASVTKLTCLLPMLQNYAPPWSGLFQAPARRPPAAPPAQRSQAVGTRTLHRFVSGPGRMAMRLTAAAVSRLKFRKPTRRQIPSTAAVLRGKAMPLPNGGGIAHLNTRQAAGGGCRKAPRLFRGYCGPEQVPDERSANGVPPVNGFRVNNKVIVCRVSGAPVRLRLTAVLGAVLPVIGHAAAVPAGGISPWRQPVNRVPGFPCGEHAPQVRVCHVASKYVVARSVAKCLSDLRTVPVA